MKFFAFKLLRKQKMRCLFSCFTPILTPNAVSSEKEMENLLFPQEPASNCPNLDTPTEICCCICFPIAQLLVNNCCHRKEEQIQPQGIPMHTLDNVPPFLDKNISYDTIDSNCITDKHNFLPSYTLLSHVTISVYDEALQYHI